MRCAGYIAALAVSLLVAAPQKTVAQDISDFNDTTFVVPPSVDSSLVNSSIFSLLRTPCGGEIIIDQSENVAEMFQSYLYANPKRHTQGYRILVYSSNAQSARGTSAEIESVLRETYPGMGVYRSYNAPVFTVTIGNFRTKNDAMELCNALQMSYSQAKIIKSEIDWYTF